MTKNATHAARIVLASASFLALLASPAAAQIAPDRLYYGVDRRVPMTVERPAGAEGDLSIRLLEPVTAAQRGTASVSEGGVDLAALFPELWSDSPTLRYAQLFAGDTPVGPAVVLQPMVSPSLARIDPRARNRVVFGSMGDTYSGIRAYVDKDVVLTTTAGEMVFRLRPDIAPNTSWNFRHLAEGGYYTDVLFHRIIDARQGRDPFVIQVGDPTGTGTGGPGYFIDLENSTLPHDFGVLSMARSSDPNSNGSQVFVALSRNGTLPLDGSYCSFAQAISGTDAILAIAATPVDQMDRPAGVEPKIISATLRDAAPYGTGPAPVVRPEAEPVQR